MTWKETFFDPPTPEVTLAEIATLFGANECQYAGIPYGGDEYRCFKCWTVWARDEPRPPCRVAPK